MRGGCHGLQVPLSSTEPMMLDALDEEHGLEPPSSEALSDQRPEHASQRCH